MASKVVHIDARQIHDRRTFHEVFAEAFGFPDFYGRNMDAWIDCMSSIGYPDDGMSKVHAPPGGFVVIALDHANEFRMRCPELFDDLVQCAALVNYRLLERGEAAVLALSCELSTDLRKSKR